MGSLEIERLMTVREVTTAFNVSYWSLYRAIRNDRSFPVINIGPKKNYRIRPSDFNYWLKGRYVNGLVLQSSRIIETSLAAKKGTNQRLHLQSPPPQSVRC